MDGGEFDQGAMNGGALGAEQPFYGLNGGYTQNPQNANYGQASGQTYPGQYQNNNPQMTDGGVSPCPAGDYISQAPAGPPKVENSHLQKCLNVWYAKNVPLPPVIKWTKIGGGVSVFGIGGNAITDQGNTAPNKSIVLIEPPVSVLSTQRWNLLNPSGLYCIKSSTSVISNVIVNLAQGAFLTESSVNVNVLSKNPQGLSGVNVMSDIRVRTLGGASY